ncbi:MAG: iron uptake porin, partial [Gloeomargarita sp. SKYG98]|nr:iron uptake porin [Gloeomargarita sp. SKYG98]
MVKPPAHQGRQATTRFEFAAGLNACLNQINKQMAASVENLVTRDDLLVIQRLQEEFAAELSVIRGRVDAIEARTTLLEQQQFSTVTQLRVGLILSPYGVADSRVARNRIENELLRGRRNLAETTTRSVVASSSPKARIADKLAFGYRVSLNFDTSFTGQDRLRLRLRAGDAANLAGATGTNEARLSFDAATEGRFLVDYLSYDFTFDRNRGRAMIAGGNTEFYDYFPTYNPLASDAAGSVSRFGRFNPLFYRAGNNSGSGALVGY